MKVNYSRRLSSSTQLPLRSAVQFNVTSAACALPPQPVLHLLLESGQVLTVLLPDFAAGKISQPPHLIGDCAILVRKPGWSWRLEQNKTRRERTGGRRRGRPSWREEAGTASGSSSSHVWGSPLGGVSSGGFLKSATSMEELLFCWPRIPTFYRSAQE